MVCHGELSLSNSINCLKVNASNYRVDRWTKGVLLVWQALGIMDDAIPRDRYCAANISLESCSALFVELEPDGEERTQFMFWRHRAPFREFCFAGNRIRDLKPGDSVVHRGKQRRVRVVKIFR